MKPFAVLLMLLVSSGLVGCGKFVGNVLGEPTPYQPFNGSSFNSRKYGGYSETRLAPNVYRVTFTGDGFTPPVVATDYALLRSADLALQQGFSHFAIVSGADQVQLGTTATPSTTAVTGYQQLGNTLYETRTTRPGTTYTTAMPSSTNTIVLFKGKPADQTVLVYDARDIYEQLTTRYEIRQER